MNDLRLSSLALGFGPPAVVGRRRVKVKPSGVDALLLPPDSATGRDDRLLLLFLSFCWPELCDSVEDLNSFLALVERVVFGECPRPNLLTIVNVPVVDALCLG